MKYKIIYDKMPIFVQNIMTSLYGKKLIKNRYGKEYYNHLDFLRKNFYTINHYDYQLQKLNELLAFSKSNSVFYNERISDSLLPLSNVSELRNIDFLTKEDIRSNINEIVTSSKESLSPAFTGGTTGKSLNVYNYYDDLQRRMAFLDYFKERHGVIKGMRRASFTGKNLVPLEQKKKNYWRYNRPLNQLLFSSFHLTQENIPYYVNALNKFKPESLDGFPSVMLIIAKYIIKNNIVLNFKPIAIFPTAETISDNDKETIEKAFNAKVRNQYASSEGAPFITECENGSLHLDIMTGVFERLDSNKSVSEIVVSSFETKGTPLVRYKIGDSLEFSEEKCDCGYDTPIVRRILGRSMDFLYSVDRGKISSANISNTIKNLPNSVISVQFVQNSKTEIDILLIVDKKLFKIEHEEDILEELKIRLGSNMKFEIKYLENIVVEKSGKFRMVKNNIKNIV